MKIMKVLRPQISQSIHPIEVVAQARSVVDGVYSS